MSALGKLFCRFVCGLGCLVGFVSLTGSFARAADADEVAAALEMLARPSAESKVNALYKIAALEARAEAALPAVLAAFQDPTPNVRVSAAMAAGRIRRSPD